MNKPSLRKLAAAIVVGAIIPTASFAAMTIYLKIDSIPGEVQAKGHEKSIEVSAFSWGMQRISAANAGGMSTGKPCAQVTGLELSKPTDISSPVFMTNVVSGMTIPKAKLSLVHTGEIQQEFMTFDLTGVTVSGYQQAGSGDDRPFENVSLKFTGATVTYRPQDAKGGLGTAATSTFKAGAC
jgi:type VI secretion system secreted protein Hcp